MRPSLKFPFIPNQAFQMLHHACFRLFRPDPFHPTHSRISQDHRVLQLSFCKNEVCAGIQPNFKFTFHISPQISGLLPNFIFWRPTQVTLLSVVWISCSLPRKELRSEDKLNLHIFWSTLSVLLLLLSLLVCACIARPLVKGLACVACRS